MALPCLGLGWFGSIRWVILSQRCINISTHQFGKSKPFSLRTNLEPFYLHFCKIKIGSFHGLAFLDIQRILLYNCNRPHKKGQDVGMLIYEYKLDGAQAQYAAIDEAIRVC